jgi:site-specific DNA-methyltransferase (adenine-specific)
MARPGARTATPSVHTTVRTARSTLSFYQADCLDVFASLPSESVSVIVTSPPYNLGVEYRSYDDTLPRDEYLAWTEAWTSAAARVLEPHGSLFLNLGAKPTDPWTAMDIAQAARKSLNLQNTIHWIKSIAIDKDAAGVAAGLERDLAVGHYKPINSPRFLNDCHEFIFHFTPSGRTPLDRRGIGVEYQDASNIARWRSGGANRRCRGNAWFIPYDTIKSRDKDRPHPATFPPRLAEYCLRLHGRERIRTAMDPFLGLGSAAVAASRLDIDFIGVEIDADYLADSIRRVNEELNERGLFEDGGRRRRRPRVERKA